MHWRKKVLTGKESHFCYDWDGLPVDESTDEIRTCHCFDPSEERLTVIGEHYLRSGSCTV